MLFSSIVLALVAAVSAQGPGGSVTSDVSPDSSTPSSCQKTFQGGQGTFTFNTHNLTKRDSIPEFEEMEKRQATTLCGNSLTLTLNNGKLLDAKGRTGYIAANRQFQFDGPPQAGAIYTAGWSYCSNNSLALGGSYIYYNCLSGTFSNIYDQSQGNQCYPVTIELIPCQGSGAPVTVATSVPTSAASSVAMMTSVTSVPTSMAASAMTVVPSVHPVPSVAPPSAVNTTAVAPTGTGSPSTGATTTAATTPSPSPFTGAGSIVIVGSKVAALVAGVAAFALF